MISTILLIILIAAFALLCLKLLFWPYNKQWESLFNSGKAPKTLLGPNSISQDWSVRMITGPIPSLDFWPFRHGKHVYLSVFDKEQGHNILFDDVYWGAFVLDGPRLDYSNFKGFNSEYMQRIQDIIHTTPNPNVMIGKFYYKLFGKYRFLGFFTMENSS